MIRKLLILLCINLYTYSCSSLKQSTGDYGVGSEDAYRVDKIKSKNNWNIIYVSKNDSIYKIVSRKENNCSLNRKIKIGKYYKFIMHSERDDSPTIDGLEIDPVNYLDIECFSYDEKTEICIEPKKNIFDLYSAENLHGLCILDKELN